MSPKQFAWIAALALLLAACGVSEVPPQATTPATALAAPTTPPVAAPAQTTAPVQVANPTPTPIPPNTPLAARVNGRPIVLAEFEKNVTRRQAVMQQMGMNLNTPEGQAAITEMRRQILEGMIEQEIIDGAAASQGISVSQAEVDAEVNRAIAESGGQEAFNQYLANVAGMTMDEYRDGQRQGMLTQKMIDRITRDLPNTAEQVHARHILLNTQAEANTVLAKLKAGADFATLAQQYSKDPITAGGGGDLGWFPRNGLFDAALEKAAFDLKPGQISGIVQSDLSGEKVYHIVQVIERDPARVLSDEALLQAKRVAFQHWLDDAKAQAKIERLVK